MCIRDSCCIDGCDNEILGSKCRQIQQRDAYIYPPMGQNPRYLQAGHSQRSRILLHAYIATEWKRQNLNFVRLRQRCPALPQSNCVNITNIIKQKRAQKLHDAAVLHRVHVCWARCGLRHSLHELDAGFLIPLKDGDEGR